MVENSNTPPSLPDQGNRGPGKRLSPREISILRQLFRKNIGVALAAETAHVNVKTARRYYKKWSEELLQLVDKNLIERIDFARERVLNAIDIVLLDVIEHMKKINDRTSEFESIVKIRLETEPAKFNTVDFFLENKRIELNKFYVELIDLKARNEMAPRLTETIEQHLKEVIKKRNMFSDDSTWFMEETNR